MIRSVTAINFRDEELKLKLDEVNDGIYIRKIDGLGPVQASINSSAIGAGDGSYFNSARIGDRNIVLSLGFIEEPNIESVRQRSYRYFPVKKPITLLFELDNRSALAYGIVERNEPDIFSPMETSQISIICNDPYLYAFGKDAVTETVFSGIEPLFEFPFENDSLLASTIQFSEIRSRADQVITYLGDADVGVEMRIYALGPISNIEIHNITDRTTMRLDSSKIQALTGSGIVAGDEIVISTVRRNRYISLIRNGVSRNILNALDKGSDWLMLTSGDNVFAYSADSGEANLQFVIRNQLLYDGI